MEVFMKTHEYDAWLDLQPDEHFELPYDEQLLAMQQFEECQNDALKQVGAREALKELQYYLYYCGTQDEMRERLLGLDWAIKAIDRRLADLDPVATKGGVL